MARDLTISSKDIPELEVWPSCCLGGYGCLYCWQIGWGMSLEDIVKSLAINTLQSQ